MADRGFARGGANLLFFLFFFQKLHENEEIFGQRGGVHLSWQQSCLKSLDKIESIAISCKQGCIVCSLRLCFLLKVFSVFFQCSNQQRYHFALTCFAHYSSCWNNCLNNYLNNCTKNYFPLGSTSLCSHQLYQKSSVSDNIYNEVPISVS